MSAITGIIHFNNEPISIEHGTRLMSDLRKYPADDIQIWHKENIFWVSRTVDYTRVSW